MFWKYFVVYRDEMNDGWEYYEGYVLLKVGDCKSDKFLVEGDMNFDFDDCCLYFR